MPAVFGYWGIRGISEPIRYLLHYVGADFEDRRFELTADRNNWKSVKDKLGLQFPNLPFYTDDDIKLTQTICILRYLAKKYGLAGHNEDENTTLDLLEQTAVDLMVNLNKMSYRPDFEQQVGPYLEVLAYRLSRFSDYLGDKKYVLGDRLTYVDFYLFEALDHNRMLKASCLDDFQNLKDYMDRIKALPKLKSYLTSDEFLAWPIYAPMAKFGGTGTYPMYN